MKFLKWLGVILLVLIIMYFPGPSLDAQKYTVGLPSAPAAPLALDQYVREHEAHIN